MERLPEPCYNYLDIYCFNFVTKKEIVDSKSKLINIFVVRDSNGTEYNVLPFDWQNRKDYSPPPIINCKFDKFKRNRPIFKQVATKDTEHPYFLKGRDYEFEFLRLETKQSTISRSYTYIVMRGIDGYEYQTLLLPHQNETILKNRRLICRFLFIEENGKLRFDQISLNSFIYFTDIIHDANLEENIFNEIKSTVTGEKVKKLFEDYENKENIWIFSFCEILKHMIDIKLNEKDFPKTKYLIELLVVFESWILNSHFLESFNSDNKEVVKEKAAKYIATSTALLQLIDLIDCNKLEQYFCNITEKPDLLTENDYLIIEYLIDHIDLVKLGSLTVVKFILKFCASQKSDENKYQNLNILKLITKHKQTIRKKVYFYDNDEKEINFKSNFDNASLHELILLTYAEILAYDLLNNIIKYNLTRANYYRLLSFSTEDKRIKLALLELALNITSSMQSNIKDEYFSCMSDLSELFDFSKIQYHNILLNKWDILEQAYLDGSHLEAQIIDKNLCGYLVKINDLIGILPSAHIPKIKISEISLGNFIEVIIIKIQPHIRKYIVSGLVNEKDILDRQKQISWEEIYCLPGHINNLELQQAEVLKTLKKGERYKGKIKNIAPFGLFVSYCGLDGLVHKSDISWSFINSIDDDYYIGQEIEFTLKEINYERKKINFSIKELLPNSKEILSNLNNGDQFQGVISNIVPYGLFVKILGIDGLLHISDLFGDTTFYRMKDFILGQKLDVKIKEINYEDGTFSLILNDLYPSPLSDLIKKRDEQFATYNIGDTVKGRVKAIENYGLFISLNNVDALLHRTDIFRNKYFDHKNYFYLGEEVCCTIKNIDHEKKKIWLKLRDYPFENALLINPCVGSQVSFTIVALGINSIKFITDNSLYGFYRISVESFNMENFKIGNRCCAIVNKAEPNSSFIQLTDIIIVQKDIGLHEDATNYSLVGNNSNELFNGIKDKIKNKPSISERSKEEILIRSIIYEEAYSLEYYSFLHTDIDDQIEFLEWAKLYYHHLSAKRELLIGTISNYFYLIKSFETCSDIIKVKEIVDNFINNIDLKIDITDKYPVILSIIKTIEILKYFGDHSEDSLKLLINIIFSDDIEKYFSKVRLAKLVLSNNLLMSEKIDNDFIERNKKMISKFLLDGIIELTDISQNEQDDEEAERKTMINDIIRSIERGENQNTEFKSTLRVSLTTNNIEKTIEHSVFKTIAAFLNSDGGQLLIGVSDSGEILGLENDFRTFKSENKIDDFRKHFDNLLEKYLGNQYADRIILEHCSIDNRDIFRVIVDPNLTPVWLSNKDMDEFFIRRTASTKQLSSRELVDYIQDHFGK